MEPRFAAETSFKVDSCTRTEKGLVNLHSVRRRIVDSTVHSFLKALKMLRYSYLWERCQGDREKEGVHCKSWQKNCLKILIKTKKSPCSESLLTNLLISFMTCRIASFCWMIRRYFLTVHDTWHILESVYSVYLLFMLTFTVQHFTRQKPQSCSNVCNIHKPCRGRCNFLRYAINTFLCNWYIQES